jgi:hypothetical protein
MQHLARYNCKKHMEQSPCRVVFSHTTSHEIPFILRNLKNCDLVLSRRPLNCTLPRQIQSISAPTTSARLLLIFSYHPCVAFYVRSSYWTLQKKSNMLCLSDPFCWRYISHRSHPSPFCDIK